MADLENSTDLLRQALDEIRKKGIVTAETLDSLNKALKKSQKAINDETDDREKLAKEAEEAAKRTKELVQGFKDITRNLGSAAQGVRDNRDDFRALKPAVDAFGKAASLSAGKLGEGISALGNIISGVSMALGPIGKLIGTGVGFAVSTLGDQVKKHGKDVVEFATAYAKFSLDEIQRVVGAYQDLSKYGGITARSFAGLQDDAQALGLSMDQYAKLIAQNAQGLATMGGSVTAGASAVKDITVASKEFEKDFLALGIGFTEQRDLTAKFLAYQRINTQINLRDTQALSVANKNYIELVDELARMTGKSRDKVSQELEATARELRYGASIGIAQLRGTETAVRKAEGFISTQFGPEMLKGFKDIFGGVATEEAKDIQLATGGAAYELGQQLREGKITFVEYARAMTEAMTRTRGNNEASLKLEESIGRLGSPIDKYAVAQRLATKVTEEMIQEADKGKKTQEDLKGATDKNKDTIVDAQIGLRNMAVEIDRIVSQKLFPTMAKGVKQLTGVLEAGASTLAKVLGVEVPSGVTGGGAGGGGGAPLTRREEAAIPTEMGGLAKKIIGAEGGSVTARNPYSSASGLGQITRGRFEDLVKSVPIGHGLKGKTFEEYQKSAELQQIALNTQIENLRSYLASKNLSTTDAAVYLAHVFGPGGARSVLTTGDQVEVERLFDQNTIRTNPAIFNGVKTVGDLKAVVDAKMGNTGYQFGGIASGPKSGYASMLHGTEAIIPLPGGRSVPVEMTGMTDKMGEQVGILEAQTTMLADLVDLMRTSVFTQEKIYRATSH